MRRRHFEAFEPVCPVCRAAGGGDSPLEIACVERERGDAIDEGLLRCASPRCLSEFPILDGIPVLVPGLRDYVAGQLHHLTSRDDLSATLESVLGDCCGPGTAYDATRQQLSSYASDHYRDLDPADGGASSVAALLGRALDLAGEVPPGPVIDLGCATGRTTFELAERLDRPVLGVDLHFAMLRLAARVLREGTVRYPRRRVGVVYDRRQHAARFARAGRVDFWACDATALPFPSGRFAAASSLNVLDCVASPLDALSAIEAALAPGGKAWIASPYDWSAGATPFESWLGGHSQRGPAGGASEPVLRALLTPGAHPASLEGLEIVAEETALPWRVRTHERSAVEYAVDLVVVKRRSRRDIP